MRELSQRFIVILTFCILGCDHRPGTAPAPATAPTATTAPAAEDQTPRLVRPATTQSAVPAVIEIDDNEYDFPPITLTLRQQDDEILALLTTIDPPNASDPDYRGNSVYLEFPLQITETRTLDRAFWEFKATHTGQEDEIEGIYLDGRKRRLQPYDVRADVVGDISPVTVRLAGTFLMFDEHADTGKPVKLSAQIVTTVKVESTER